MNKRREDARRKILLGALTIKAGMDKYPPAVILGALAQAKQALEGANSAAVYARFQAVGDALFREGSGGT